MAASKDAAPTPGRWGWCPSPALPRHTPGIGLINLGARLEPANKLYDTEVIISQTTADQVKGQFITRELDLLAVKGKTIPMAVYELMAEGSANGDVRARVEQYADGLAHYRAQRWDDAQAAWRRLLRLLGW